MHACASFVLFYQLYLAGNIPTLGTNNSHAGNESFPRRDPQTFQSVPLPDNVEPRGIYIEDGKKIIKKFQKAYLLTKDFISLQNKTK